MLLAKTIVFGECYFHTDGFDLVPRFQDHQCMLMFVYCSDDELFGSPKKKRKGSAPTAAELLAQDRAEGDWDESAIAAIEVWCYLHPISYAPTVQAGVLLTSRVISQCV